MIQPLRVTKEKKGFKTFVTLSDPLILSWCFGDNPKSSLNLSNYLKTL